MPTSAARLLIATLLLACTAARAAGQDAPVLSGRVVTVDGAAPAGLRAFLRWRAPGDTAARVDSAAVDSAGRFRIPLPERMPDSVVLIVDAADRERRTHHPALARMAGAEAAREHGVALVPRAWTIPAGRYAGQTVPVSPDRARLPVCAGCSSFWARMPGTRPATTFQGWPLSRFPLRMAFDRANSVPAGAAPDSAAFWQVVQAVEDALGMDAFRPVPYRQTLPSYQDEDPDDVVLVSVVRELTTAGLTTIVGSRGNVEYAGLSLQRAGEVLAPNGPQLVAHELMHVLGLGHTCAWRSVLADISRCAGLRAATVTPEDVAYTQILYRMRELQRGGTLRWGLDAAVAGERELVLGVPAEGRRP